MTNDYAAALERARQGKPIDEIFPELRESEDERVRQRIVALVEQFAQGLNRGPMLAYLEKQKEQPKEELIYRLNGLMQDYIKDGKNEEEREHRFKCYQLFWDALEEETFFEQKEQKLPEMELLTKLEKALFDMLVERTNEITISEKQAKKYAPIVLAIVKKEQKSEQSEMEREYVETLKGLVSDFIRDTGSGITDVAYYQKICDWLDRRHIEQKPDTRDADDLQLLGFICDLLNEIKWKDSWAMSKEECLRRLNDYRPQKPAEWSYPYGINETVDRIVSIAECLEMDGDCLFNDYSGTECGKFLRDLARKEIECKPAEWSKNDTVFLNEITDYFENKTVRLQHDIDMYAHWLKSLPKRFNLQPKQEWTEEDEVILKDIKFNFEYNKENMTPALQEEYDKFFAKIKSLRPQKLVVKQEKNEKHIADIFEKVGLAKIVREQGNDELTNALQNAMLELSKVGNAGWSEEDEERIQRIHNFMWKNRKGDTDTIYQIEKDADWLESLPERFNLQSKQEWSIKDEAFLKVAIAICNRYSHKDIANWLKSLRSRPKSSDNWKPSEQEKGALRTAIHILTDERSFPKAAAHLQNILDAFEGEEPRNEWKPNEEQMNALEHSSVAGENQVQ